MDQIPVIRGHQDQVEKSRYLPIKSIEFDPDINVLLSELKIMIGMNGVFVMGKQKDGQMRSFFRPWARIVHIEFPIPQTKMEDKQ